MRSPDSAFSPLSTPLDELRAKYGGHDGSCSPIPLEPGHAFDPMTCCLLQGNVGSDEDEGISLTAVEANLLSALLLSPRCYHSPHTLAWKLGCLDIDGDASGYACDPIRHRVEQAISRLRSKLAAAGCSPRLLRTRRGLGYGLFPAALPPTQLERAGG